MAEDSPRGGWVSGAGRGWRVEALQQGEEFTEAT